MSEPLFYDNSFVFFDGRVILRNFISNGVRVTLGFMAKGEYRWLAEEAEHFIIDEGEAIFSYDNFEFVASPSSEIIIPKGMTFNVNVRSHLDYWCYYA
ncbi:pyrimidine/purine nucleoside phosphorylase [Xenorhabdus khoisanae]|uniref:Uncharacterized protein n=1 Tax=Xenorhabdus khoisanae TaxID=880157 RepID=A0A0J5FVC8_9GAMM|nr:pyrimidine/purine nucleoside phosphorylase [Xenorhabdus khoisanae]KMJ46119.1 hypothetical protein AB204_05350 [Xenorhabdus khoisanae]